jgi:two-component system response regulator NreC
MKRCARVLVAENLTDWDSGMRQALGTIPDITVIAEVADGVNALKLAETLEPDVLVIADVLPRVSGLDVVAQLKKRRLSTHSVLVTGERSRPGLGRLIRAGAMCYVQRDMMLTELPPAIACATRGESFLCPGIASVLLEDVRANLERKGSVTASGPRLTDRQVEVLQLVAEGRSNRSVAQQLGLSVKTVETHRDHIMKKLSVHDRTDLVKYAIKVGLISLN